MSALNPFLNLPAVSLPDLAHPVLNVLAESAVRSLALGLLAWGGLRLLRLRHAAVEKQAWSSVLLLGLAMPLLVALRIPRITLPYEWVSTVWTPPHPGGARAEAVPKRTAAVHSWTGSGPVMGSVSRPSKAPHFLTRPALLPTAWPARHSSAAQRTDDDAAPGSLNIPVPPELQSTTAAAVHATFPWGLFGVLVYSLVSAALLLRLGVGLLLAARMWRRAEPFAQTTAPGTNFPVRMTAELDSPVTLGRGILLPLEAAEWDSATLRTTLAHEAAHIRAGDFFLQLAANLHLALFWISPLAWWLPAELSRLSETICDRAALRAAGDGLSYAQLLLRFAAAGRAPSAMLAMAHPAGLRQRIEQLIADPQLASAFRQRRGQAAAALLFVSMAAVGSAATIRILDPLLDPMCTVLAAQRPPALQSPAPPPTPIAPVAAMPATPPAAPQHSVPAVPPAAASPAVPAPEAAPAPPAPAADVPAVPPPVAPAAPVAPADLPVDVAPDVWMNGGDSRHSFAILPGNGDEGTISTFAGQDAGDWHRLKQQHPGGVLWFHRDGKSYVIDDPTLVKQARQAYAPVQQLGKQQGELGERQGALGEQQGKLGEQQGEIGEKQGEWSAKEAELAQNFKFDMPPEFADAVAQLTEAATRLGFEHDQLDPTQRAELEAQKQKAQATIDKATAELRAQQPQREAMEKQIREQTEQMRRQMEPMMKQMTELAHKQGVLARQQAELGRQQALLGEQQRKASREAEQKVQQLIDQAMREGKARPAP